MNSFSYSIFALTITAAGITLIISLLSLRRVIQRFGIIYSYTLIFVKSLSLMEIVILSSSENDRAGFIKDFYDFKHKNISAIIKGISSIIVANVAVLVKNYFDKGLNVLNLNANNTTLILITFGLLLSNFYFIIKLNKCVTEFSKTIKIYESLR